MKLNFFSWIISFNLFYPLLNAIFFEILSTSKTQIIGTEATIFSILFITMIMFLGLFFILRKMVQVILIKKINTLASLIIIIYLLFVCLQFINFKFNNFNLNLFEIGNKYYIYLFYTFCSLIISIRYGNIFLKKIFNSQKFFFYIVFLLILLTVFIDNNSGSVIKRFHLSRLDPNSVLVFASVILLYLTNRIFFLKQSKSYYQIILSLFPVLLSLYVINKTNSVGILFSLLFAIIILFKLNYQKNKILIIFLSSIILSVVFFNNENFTYRFNNLISDENSSLFQRLIFYSFALSYDNLLNGFLLGANISFAEIFSFHNSLLELYYSGGFFLLILFAFILLKILISFSKIINLNNLFIDKFLLVLLIFLILNSFIGGIFSINAFFWSVLGLVISRLSATSNESFLNSSKLKMKRIY